jgi:hypothetical protein
MSGVSVSGFSFLRCCYTLLLTPYHRPLAPLRHITSVEVKLSRSSNRSLLPHLTADQYHEKGTTTRLTYTPLTNAYRLSIAITALPYLNATTMTRTYTHSIADNSVSSQLIQPSMSNPPKALSLRSSSTASMLPKPRRAAVPTRSSGWDTPRMSQQQRIVMQRFDKQAKHGKLMQRLFGHRLVPGFLR